MLLPFLFGMVACHNRKANPAPKPDYARVKARAETSFNELGPGKSGPKPAKNAVTAAPAPEAPAATSTVGEKDAKLGCTWVEAEATVPVGGNESRDQARARTIEKALAAAMQDLLGVDVNQRSLDFQQESLRGQTNLIESVLRTTRRGCIINEKINIEEYRDLGTCRQCGFFVALKACIKERPADWDKDFLVELLLPRDHFMEGDRTVISVTPRRDAYLYLYDVGMNSETALVAPNEYIPEVKGSAGQTWQYPDADAVKRYGLYLEAQLPADRPPVSAETIRVIATKVPLPAKLSDPTQGGYLGVLQRLDSAGIEWAEDAAAFTISPAKER
jgi:hypothetical protein